MIVFSLKSTGLCMLRLGCDLSEITIENNKAYYKGQIVNNNMEISDISEFPYQSITNDDMDLTPKNITELVQYTNDEKWNVICKKRDKLLTECDWTQLPDSPKYQDQDWLTYRQALRDITTQTDVDSIVWPEKPTEAE